MRPLFDRILVKRDPLPEKKIGSIYLPDENSETKVPPWGEVVEIGELCTTIKKGDRVLFTRYSYVDLDKENDLIIIKEDDILGIEDDR